MATTKWKAIRPEFVKEFGGEAVVAEAHMRNETYIDAKPRGASYDGPSGLRGPIDREGKRPEPACDRRVGRQRIGLVGSGRQRPERA